MTATDQKGIDSGRGEMLNASLPHEGLCVPRLAHLIEKRMSANR